MAETRDLVPASILVAVQFIVSEVNLSQKKKKKEIPRKAQTNGEQSRVSGSYNGETALKNPQV